MAQKVRQGYKLIKILIILVLWAYDVQIESSDPCICLHVYNLLNFDYHVEYPLCVMKSD